MPDLWGKGTKGRDASPKSQQRSRMDPAKPAQGIGGTGVGTPLGGTPSSGGTGPTGTIDPAAYNVDLHAVRVFSRYWNGKRAGPDWLHKRVEAAERKRDAEAGDLAGRS